MITDAALVTIGIALGLMACGALLGTLWGIGMLLASTRPVFWLRARWALRRYRKSAPQSGRMLDD